MSRETFDRMRCRDISDVHIDMDDIVAMMSLRSIQTGVRIMYALSRRYFRSEM
jgi:hypothetical protein